MKFYGYCIVYHDPPSKAVEIRVVCNCPEVTKDMLRDDVLNCSRDIIEVLTGPVAGDHSTAESAMTELAGGGYADQGISGKEQPTNCVIYRREEHAG